MTERGDGNGSFEQGASARRSRITLGVFLGLLGILLWANYEMVAPYLLAVLMGAILAILFRRLHRFLVAHRIGPRIAAGTVVLGIALLLIVPLSVFVTMAASQATEAAQKLMGRQDLSVDQLSQKVTKWKPAKVLLGNASAVEARIREGMKKVASAAPGVVFGIFGGLPEFLLQVALGLLSCYFFLIDGAAFVSWLRERIPLDPEVRGTIFNAFQETAVSTTLATVSAATAQTAIVTIGFFLLGVHMVFLAGGLTFILAWVPLVGSSPVWLGGSLYLFAQGSVGKGIAMLGVGALTGLSDNFIYPWILKGRGELHPLVSLVAIFGGIQLFGVFGVFVGPILAALLVSALRIWPHVAERFGILKAAQIVTSTDTAAPPRDIT